MDVLHERCAGIDISKADVKVCVRTPSRNKQRHSAVRTFSAMTGDLLAMRDWLIAEQVTVVGMEATGPYWKPVFYLLEDQMRCWLLNAQHMKAVPGRKTDVMDAEWIAKLIEHGLVRPSFVPPPPIRRLQDLTRYRTAIVRDRGREAQRLHNMLEDAGIKLTSVVSDVLGKSGRAMIEALIAGERDPHALAELALGRLRAKSATLIEALTGRFEEHHAFLARTMLDRIDTATAMVVRLDERIAALIEPYGREIELLATIPGISATTAQAILAEIGADITQFPSAGHLASWAGICPGNHESAGKHTAGTTRPGDPWLKGVLGQAAISAARGKDTYLGARYRRLVIRRGRARALVALQHSMLIAIWHMFTTDTPYHDLGANYFLDRAAKTTATRRLIGQLNHLGYQVTLNPLGAA
ncbi:IS110 family transposase [Mycobacterium sp. 29Ha]|uniref:IS110 family transposase n=1 Tax=Mycobacterium sp. 29Ha TaxID=2939268 RepID=UPI002938D756|nr:IS110 family transposase [Mycobacterium sp. 29Ha]MDV3133405.1 IS110 family transposase [Mycobacterium sp. 29Ha]